MRAWMEQAATSGDEEQFIPQIPEITLSEPITGQGILSRSRRKLLGIVQPHMDSLNCLIDDLNNNPSLEDLQARILSWYPDLEFPSDDSSGYSSSSSAIESDDLHDASSKPENSEKVAELTSPSRSSPARENDKSNNAAEFPNQHNGRSQDNCEPEVSHSKSRSAQLPNA